MDHSGVTDGLCEKTENDNKEIAESSNAKESAEKTELATLVSPVSSSLPIVSDNSTTGVIADCNTQLPLASTDTATSMDISVSANVADGKSSVVTADVVPINTVASSGLPQGCSNKMIPTSSDAVTSNSSPMNSSSNVSALPLLSASTSVVTEPNLNVDSSTSGIPTNPNSSAVKTEQKNLSYIPFQVPAAHKAKTSAYDSSKVAAEMAEIDSFLKSLASGANGGSNDSHNPTKPVPLSSSSTAAVNDIVVRPAAGGSALGRIAQSYGDSDESSSSSSDESEDEELGATADNKMATAPAAVAMDTSEVEQSMKKVVVSSDNGDSSSSSSCSDDELG